MDRDAIGRNCRAMRQNLGLSQAELAGYLGKVLGRTIHQTTLSSIESGRNAPSMQMLTGLCAVYGVTPDELMGVGGNADNR